MFEWIQIYDHAALLWLQEHFRNAVLNTFMAFIPGWETAGC